MNKLTSKLKEKIQGSSQPSNETSAHAENTDSNMSVPKTSKAFVFEKPGEEGVFRDIDIKPLDKHEVLVKVLACGVCASDFGVQAGHFGPLPRIPGHELVGDVVAVGSEVSKWKIGDRVGGPWHGGHDGVCRECNRGDFQMCKNEAINGVTRDGGYQTYCTLRSEAVVRIDKNADPAEVAPLLCAGVTLYNSIRKMGITPGDTIAVQGLGGLGHLGLQYASKMGYRTVALSSSDSKRDFAKKLGAHEYIDGSKEDQAEALQKLGGADLIVITASDPKAVTNLVGGLAARGTLLILAPMGDVTVSTLAMIGKAINVRCWPSGHALDSEEAIAFARTHGVKCMVEKFPFEKATEAIEHTKSGKARFRSVIVME